MVIERKTTNEGWSCKSLNQFDSKYLVVLSIIMWKKSWNQELISDSLQDIPTAWRDIKRDFGATKKILEMEIQMVKLTKSCTCLKKNMWDDKVF